MMKGSVDQIPLNKVISGQSVGNVCLKDVAGREVEFKQETQWCRVTFKRSHAASTLNQQNVYFEGGRNRKK